MLKKLSVLGALFLVALTVSVSAQTQLKAVVGLSLPPYIMQGADNGVDADIVYAYFLQHVDEKEYEHTLADLVAAWLGF